MVARGSWSWTILRVRQWIAISSADLHVILYLWRHICLFIQLTDAKYVHSNAFNLVREIGNSIGLKTLVLTTITRTIPAYFIHEKDTNASFIRARHLSNMHVNSLNSNVSNIHHEGICILMKGHLNISVYGPIASNICEGLSACIWLMDQIIPIVYYDMLSANIQLKDHVPRDLENNVNWSHDFNIPYVLIFLK